MCAVSAVIDNFTRPYLGAGTYTPPTYATRDELDRVRERFERELKALRELLPHVQKYDEVTGQPNCESDEKLKLLRGIAEKLGVDVKGIA